MFDVFGDGLVEIHNVDPIVEDARRIGRVRAPAVPVGPGDALLKDDDVGPLASGRVAGRGAGRPPADDGDIYALHTLFRGPAGLKTIEATRPDDVSVRRRLLGDAPAFVRCASENAERVGGPLRYAMAALLIGPAAALDLR